MNKIMYSKFGRIELRNGYYEIRSNKEGNYGKMFHRMVWEDFYQCEIPKNYHIHHKNGVKNDNCILNLKLMPIKEHISFHNKGQKHSCYGKELPMDTKMKISKSKNTTGYFRVILMKSVENHFIWRYQYYVNKKQRYIKHTDLNKLKEKVLGKGLEWKIIDDEKAKKSNEYNEVMVENYRRWDGEKCINFSKLVNTTGFYRVSKQGKNKFHSWVYTYTDKFGCRKRIIHKDLNQLKEEIISLGLKWMVLDKERAISSLNKNEEMMSFRNRYETGFYNVSKHRSLRDSQGFVWAYNYKDDDGKWKRLSSKDLIKLKEKVVSKKLLWKVNDVMKARQTCLENNISFNMVSNEIG